MVKSSNSYLIGACMKVSPVFSMNNYPKINNHGQKFSSINFNNSSTQPCREDVFLRLAEASLKDKKIELELKSMGLI